MDILEKKQSGKKNKNEKTYGTNRIRTWVPAVTTQGTDHYMITAICTVIAVSRDKLLLDVT